MPSFLSYWTGPLPKEELYPDRKVNPLIHWLYHPFRRHLARLYVYLLQHFFGLKVIAITGSVGKTTTIEMLQSILTWAGPTVASQLNITSTYNIPATILRCTPMTRYLVLEMSIEYPGDMDFYTWLVTPDIGLITAVNLTHTAFLGSLANVASEKLKLLSASSAAIFNSNDPNTPSFEHDTKYSFGSKSTDYIQILSAKLTPDLKTEVELKIDKLIEKITLPQLGTQYASNAAAAAAAARLLDVRPQTIFHGLETSSVPPRRMHVINLPTGAILIDDTHNASPLATAASLQTLAQAAAVAKKDPVFVFGQMNELGQYEESAHREIGELVKKLNIKHLFALGEATKFTIATAGVGQYFESVEQLVAALKKFLKPENIVLIKASRAHHFENIVTALTSSPQ